MDKSDKNEETNAEHIQLLNQLDLDETGYVHLNPEVKSY